MSNKNCTIIISAPSGAGKTTLITKLLSEDHRYEFSISTTSRPRRNGEIDGRDYHFVSENDFKLSIDNDEFIEWAVVHGNYYGTSKKEIDRINAIGRIPLLDVDVQGAINLKQKIKNAFYIFIVPPSIESLKYRLKNRNTDSQDQIELRLKNAISELEQYSYYDYIVVNDDLYEALEDFKAVLKAISLSSSFMESKMKEILS